MLCFDDLPHTKPLEKVAGCLTLFSRQFRSMKLEILYLHNIIVTRVCSGRDCKVGDICTSAISSMGAKKNSQINKVNGRKIKKESKKKSKKKNNWNILLSANSRSHNPRKFFP